MALVTFEQFKVKKLERQKWGSSGSGPKGLHLPGTAALGPAARAQVGLWGVRPAVWKAWLRV